MTEELQRGVDYGPWCHDEVDPSFLDELREPARPLPKRHLLNDEADLSLHVWTRSASLYVPVGVQVYQETNEDGMADAIHIMIPEVKGRSAFTVTMSVFASATSMNWWNDEGWKLSYFRLMSDSTRVQCRKGLWGISVSARAVAQEVYVIGADGPRWSVRLTAFGTILNQRARRCVRDIMDSVVVNRHEGAILHGTPLDVSLIDRRKGHDPSQVAIQRAAHKQDQERSIAADDIDKLIQRHKMDHASSILDVPSLSMKGL